MLTASVSLFLDFQLPNATTWFYFSWLLSIALFFKFSRVLSIRNLDIITLFLLTPGILLVQASPPNSPGLHEQKALSAATLVCQSGPGSFSPASMLPLEMQRQVENDQARWRWIGYLWLLCGTGFFFLRCLWDLTLVQRPALTPNLNSAGLAWLALMLLICLTAVAFRQQMMRPTFPSASASSLASSKDLIGPNAPPMVGKEGALISLAKNRFQPPPWMTSSFAILCHLSILLGILMISRRHFQNVEAGIAAAACYLLLPYTGVFVSQVHHVWPVTLIVWSFVLYKYPSLSGFFLGIAAGTAYFPALLLPVWLSFYGKNGNIRFLTMFVIGLSLSVGTLLGVLLWQGDDLHALWRETLANASWQPWKDPTAASTSFWTGMPWAYRLPVFLAYLAFLVGTAFWPRVKNLADLIALSTALLIGVQFWYADQGGLYVLWYLPLFLLLLFRPNLEDRLAPPIARENDWLRKIRQAFARLVGKIFRKPETPATIKP